MVKFESLEEFKLYFCDIVRLEEFLKSASVKYTLGVFGYDASLSVDLSDKSLDKIDEFNKSFLAAFGEAVYALENVSLEQELIKLLKIGGAKISVAESFTGGNVSAKLTSVSGASEVFLEGIVAYSKEAKTLRLGVDAETIKKFGAVSDETAYEMARGLLKNPLCDVAVATTGIAGPNGDGTDAPVGRCFIAAGNKNEIKVFKYDFTGDRKTITRIGTETALYLAIKSLKNK